MANKNGVILEHRLVMSHFLGRMLNKNDVVHHKNGNPRDNRIDNLELTTYEEHIKKHLLKKAKTLEIACHYCNNKFIISERIHRFKKKHGQKNFYCTVSCMGKGFRK